VNKKDIVASIDEIQMLFEVDEIKCWEDVYCPYCMLNQLKSRIEKDIQDGN